MTKPHELIQPHDKVSSKTGNHRTKRYLPEVISIVCDSLFELDLICSLLQNVFPDADIRSFETASQWNEAPTSDKSKEVLLYSLGDNQISDDTVKFELRKFIADAGGRRVIVTSHSKDTMAVFEAIECGAAGFIPANAGLAELLEAISADFAKCVVIPRASLEALRAEIPASAAQKPT